MHRFGLITGWMDAAGLQQRREANGDMGGTMRLGAYEARLDGNSVVRSIYGAEPSASATFASFIRRRSNRAVSSKG